MKHKILVTGGVGYIGSHTTVELINAGYEVVIIDNLSNSNINVLDGIEKITGVRPAFVEGDCTSIETLRKVFTEYKGIDGIINFAASKAVGRFSAGIFMIFSAALLPMISNLPSSQKM